MNHNKKRLLAVLAHPDDESFGMGGALLKYAHEGIETYLLMATRGERGRYGLEPESPGPEVVGRTRTKELLEAAKILRLNKVNFLDYMDGELDQVNPKEIVGSIARHIRSIQPQVVVTFGPDGGYGHPDHIAISQFTGAGIVRAADPTFQIAGLAPFAVSKLYYIAWPQAKWDIYQAAFKKLVARSDGHERQAVPFPDWAVTTRVDASDHWREAWQAIGCHQTQMQIFQGLEQLTDEQHNTLWGRQEFYRVFSLVNGGREVEEDLFAGIA